MSEMHGKRVLITAAGQGIGLASARAVFLRAGQTIRLGIAGLGEQHQVTVQAD